MLLTAGFSDAVMSAYCVPALLRDLWRSIPRHPLNLTATISRLKFRCVPYLQQTSPHAILPAPVMLHAALPR